MNRNSLVLIKKRVSTCISPHMRHRGREAPVGRGRPLSKHELRPNLSQLFSNNATWERWVWNSLSAAFVSPVKTIAFGEPSRSCLTHSHVLTARTANAEVWCMCSSAQHLSLRGKDGTCWRLWYSRFCLGRKRAQRPFYGEFCFIFPSVWGRVILY